GDGGGIVSHSKSLYQRNVKSLVERISKRKRFYSESATKFRKGVAYGSLAQYRGHRVPLVIKSCYDPYPNILGCRIDIQLDDADKFVLLARTELVQRLAVAYKPDDTLRDVKDSVCHRLARRKQYNWLAQNSKPDSTTSLPFETLGAEPR